jgi:hypothetical protein
MATSPDAIETRPEPQGALSGRCLVIIGGTQGLGWSAAQACLREGAQLVVVGREPTPEVPQTETEQKRLESVMNIKPSAWSDPDVYGTRLIALGLALQSGIKEFNAQGADNSGLAPEAKGRARTKAMEYKKFYSELGLPPAVYSEAEYRKYPPGTEVLWQGKTPAKVSARSK